MCALFRPLTPAQEKVAKLVITGRSYKQIGKMLGLRTRTVETYVHRISDLVWEQENAHTTPYRRVQLWAINYYRDAA